METQDSKLCMLLILAERNKKGRSSYIIRCLCAVYGSIKKGPLKHAIDIVFVTLLLLSSRTRENIPVVFLYY